MLLSFGDIDKIPHKKCVTGTIFFQPTAQPTAHTHPPPIVSLILGIPLVSLVPQLYQCHTPQTCHWLYLCRIPFVPFSYHLFYPLDLAYPPLYTHRCWWLPLTPFQILISIQSLHCNVGLLVINVPRIPPYPVFKFGMPSPPNQ